MTVIEEYKALISRFIGKEISPEEFRSAFLDKFKKEKAPMSEDAFLELDWLFAEVNAYSEDPQLFLDCPESTINLAQLEESARRTLKEIQGLQT